MANSDKNIVIIPNTGDANNPNIVFSGANATLANQDVQLTVLPDSNGTLLFSASTGNLIKIQNSQTEALVATSANITGNLTANYLFGNGSQLSGVTATTASSLANGTSNVSIPASGGNVNTSVAGNANILIVTGTGVNVTGTLNATGNANAGNIGATNANVTAITATGNANVGNLGTGGLITATGNITGGNLTTGGVLSVTGNANVGNLGATNANITAITATGNANVGNLGTAGLITATGNITGGNLNTGGVLSVTGNANVGNLGTAGLITATGNITGGNLTTGGVLTVTGTGVSTITGNLDMTSNNIINLATPVNSTDAATKQYVDDVAQGLHTHDTCNAATTDTLAVLSGGTVTYNNGSSGVGANLTTTGSYTTIDGVTLSNGMRILVKNEANSAHNGIYDRTSSTVLTRSTDFDTPAEMGGGDFTFVTAGTLYDNTGWVMTDAVTTVGTSPVPWVQFSGAGTYTAGTGLTLNGSQFSISNTTVTANSYGSGDAVATFTVNPQGQLTAAANTAITANAANLTGTTLAATIVNSSLTSVGTLGNLTVTSNVTAGNVIGIFANGTSNIRIPAAGGNVTISVGGTSNVLVVTATGANITGTLNATGNANVGNIGATNANVTAITATGNANVGNLGTGGLITATGNVSGGNLTTGGQVVATGNITGGNLLTTSNLIVGDALFSRYDGNTYSEAWIYSGINYNISANETSVNGVFFSSDGANMYTTGLSDRVYQYTLGTPWNVSTASLTRSLVVQSDPQAIEFKPDGTKMYIVRDIDDRVYEYNLSTAWDISTAANSGNFSVGTQESIPFGLSFKSDGTAMYVVGDTNATVYQYALSTAWSVNSASFSSGNSFSVSAYDGTPEGIDFSSDGKQMYIAGYSTGKVYQFVLSSAWDVNSAQYVSGYNPLFPIVAAPTYTSVFVSTANNRAYLADPSTDTIYQLDTGTNAVDLVNGKLLLTQDLISNSVLVGNALTVSGNTRIGGTLISSGAATISSSLSVTGTITFSTTTSGVNLGTSQTTGALTIGGTSQTGNIIVDRSTRTHTLAIANGATESGNVKTIDFGTNGAAGSNTVINIGTSVSGNAYITLGTLNATGNIILNQLTSIQNTTPATSNNTGALTVAGGVGVSGNVYASEQVVATGNVTGNYFIGNGSLLTGISTGGASISNGTSNVNIATSGGNVTTSVGGTSNVLVVTTTGVNVAGTLNATGNANVGNLGTAGLITATGNISGGNLIATTNLSTPSITTTATNGNLTIDPNGSGNLVVSSTTPVVISNSGVANTAGALLLSGTLTSASGNVGLLHIGTPASYNITNPALWINESANATIYINYDNPNTGTETSVQTQMNLGDATTYYFYNSLKASTGAVIGTGEDLYISAGENALTGNLTLYAHNDISFDFNNTPTPITFYGSNGTARFLHTVLVDGTVNAASYSNGTSNIRVTTNSNVVISAAGSANILTVTGTGVNVAGTLNATGNANVGNIGATNANVTALTATGNANVGNIGATNANVTAITATGNANVGNLGTAGLITATGNITGGNLNTGGILTVTGNANVGNIGATNANITAITATGNANVGNLGTAGLITATGNITGGNLNTGGVLSVTGNANVGNLGTGGLITATGNITGGNIIGTIAAGSNTITTTGNITAGNFIGRLANGNSNVNIATANGNVVITAVGNTTLTITGTGANISGYANITGNANVGNIGATNANVTAITATGNANVGNLGTAGLITATSNITGGNLTTGGILSVTGNANVGNLGTAGLITATGNITGGNLNTGGVLSVTGNANVGNLGTAGLITATGNITGGNLNTGGVLSVTGNANVGNLGTAGLITATGNVTGGNLNTGGQVVATGNVTGNYFIGNGSLLTGISAGGASISNGTSNVNIATSGGNVTTSVGGTSNVLVVTTAGANITGTLDVTSNITGGNFLGVLANGNSNVRIAAANGNVVLTAVGNTVLTVTGTGANISGYANITGNANVGNLGTGGLITATGNITGGNLNTGGVLSVTGNANVGNLGTAGLITATGNVTGGNLNTGGQVVATGNITGNYFIGNGSLLTGISAGGASISNGTSNVNIATSGGNVTTSVGGTSNVLVVTTTGVNVAGTLNATGNANVGNLGTTGLTATGNANINVGAGNSVIIAATAPPTVDLLTITNTGQNVATAGINALQVIYVGGTGAIEASAVRSDMTPGTTSGSTWNAFMVAPTAAAASGVTFNGLKFDNKTAGAGTSRALFVGTGYDEIINYNGTILIYGNGIINGGQLANLATANSVVIGNGTGIPTSVAPGTTGNVLTSNGTNWISSAATGGGSSISNGTSNVSIVTANGNVTFGVGGTGNVVTVTSANLIVGTGSSGNITGANVISATTLQGFILPTAGTTATAPIDFTAGSLLSAAVAGTFEYDGTAIYNTDNTTSGRGVTQPTQMYRYTTAGSALGPTIADYFPASSSLNLEATSIYEVEAYLYFLKTTAGTATFTWLFSSGVNMARSYYVGTVATGFTTTTVTGAPVTGMAVAQGGAVTTLAHVATGSLTTAVFHAYHFKLMVYTNAATNLRIRITSSAGTVTPQAGSFYFVRKLPANAGIFAA